MLLFDGDQRAQLKEEQSALLEKLTEFISDDEAACFNTKFNRKMEKKNHHEDKRRHFFRAETIFKVLCQKNDPNNNEPISEKVKGLAFVYLANAQGKEIIIAVTAIGDDHQFLRDYIFVSSKGKNGKNDDLPYNDAKKKMQYYNTREYIDWSVFDNCRDAGIIHDPEFVKSWLDTLGDDGGKKNVRIYLGVEVDKRHLNPPLQIVMLVDNTKEELKNNLDKGIFYDVRYAVDKGNGCCPEQ